jgi:hypothetical protein
MVGFPDGIDEPLGNMLIIWKTQLIIYTVVSWNGYLHFIYQLEMTLAT